MASSITSSNWKLNISTLEERHFYMYENKICTDAILEIGTEQIEVHGSILAANSDYFEEQIQGCYRFKNNGKRIIQLGKICTSTEIMKTFIKTLYKNEYEPNSIEECIGLLKLSHFYGCKRLLINHLQFLHKKVNADNITEIFKFAVEFKNISNNFLETILECIGENANAFFDDTNAILKLSEKEFKEILAFDALIIEEMKLFNAVAAWGKYQCEIMKNPASSVNVRERVNGLIGLIRFPLMSLKEFATNVKPTKLLSTAEEIQIYTFLSLTTTENKSGWDEQNSIKEELAMEFNINERIFRERITIGNASKIYPPTSQFKLTFNTDRTINLCSLEIYFTENCWKYFGLETKEEVVHFEIDVEIYNINFSVPIYKNSEIILPSELENPKNFITKRIQKDCVLGLLSFYSIKYNVKCLTKKTTLDIGSMNIVSDVQRQRCINLTNINTSDGQNTKANFSYSTKKTRLPLECFYLTKIQYKISDRNLLD